MRFLEPAMRITTNCEWRKESVWKSKTLDPKSEPASVGSESTHHEAFTWNPATRVRIPDEPQSATRFFDVVVIILDFDGDQHGIFFCGLNKCRRFSSFVSWLDPMPNTYFNHLGTLSERSKESVSSTDVFVLEGSNPSCVTLFLAWAGVWLKS